MNRIVKNTSIYSLGQILPKAAGFIFLPIYTRFLSPEEYGIVSSMAVLQSILIVLFTLCLDRSVTRLYWDYKSEQEKKDFFGTIMISITFISSVILFLLFIFNKYTGLIYKSIDFYPFYFYAILSSFLGVFSLVPKSYFMLKEKAGIFVALSLLEFAFNASLILWFIIVKKEGAVGYLKGNLYSGIILLPIFLIISSRICNLKFRYIIFKKAFSFSLPIAPTIMTAWVLNLSDRIFLERYFTLSEVGIYSLGYKIAGLIVLFSGSFSLAYEPLFFKLANSNDQTLAKQKISKYNHIYLISIVIICFIISFLSKEVMTLFEKKYSNASLIIPLISLSYLFSSATGITSKFIRQSKKMIKNMFISIFVVIINIILNFLLIPRYGAFGAAYATIISMTLIFFTTYFFSLRYCYFVPINWRIIVPFTSILIFIVVLFQNILNLNFITSLILKTLLIVLIAIFFFKKTFPQFRDIIVRSQIYKRTLK